MILHPRSEVFGAALPRNVDNTLRPLLQPCRWLTVHWVGAGQWGDPGDTADEIRSIHRWSLNRRPATPWEYNEVVDSEGHAWIYAGEFRAAHSAGENDRAYGVLMLAGPGDEVTDAMVDTFRRRRHDLVAAGQLRADHEMLPHQQMPGARTACPGPVMDRWNELTAPWAPPAPPPEPILEEDEMLDRFRWRQSGTTNEFLVPEGLHLTPALAARYGELELITEDHPQMLASLLHRNGLTHDDLVWG